MYGEFFTELSVSESDGRTTFVTNNRLKSMVHENIEKKNVKRKFQLFQSLTQVRVISRSYVDGIG